MVEPVFQLELSFLLRFFVAFEQAQLAEFEAKQDPSWLNWLESP
jgi:hypothetical protein